MPKQKLQSRPCAVVTSCTSRKLKQAERTVFADDAQVQTLRELCSRWVEQLRRQTELLPAGRLYQGRAFREADIAADCVGAPLFILSAGLGLVGSMQEVPAYDLTISAGAGSVASALTRLREAEQSWWRELTQAREQCRPVAALLEGDEFEQVLLAMPSTYLAMIAAELGTVDPELVRRKLRIFSSPKSLSVLPASLQACVLPYDERLESTELSGTLSDFPQRSLRHFASQVNAQGASLAEARAMVTAALAGLPVREKPQRQKLSDEEITQALRQQWWPHEGSSTKLLRYLRDEAGIACEQGRFRQLWLRLKREYTIDTPGG
ncbi:hypothetical protein G8A07_00050 [Roseateles sp. DAIF2]|uniref:hypothetical protein n=1 Tax=Roseateles sp. DAIF2 TaxID=2714952 RepID=UPI0018A2AAAD|nr:hypothetical protein [Roseateles sp. DAIF2]QPF71469.1 hypothetical protein G8A07_00050 [Roseateles sp. DAIF2]